MACFFGHKWEKWSRPEQRQLMALKADGQWHEVWPMIQHRTCKDCGQYVERRVANS